MSWLQAFGRAAGPAPASEEHLLLLEDGSHVPVRWVRDARARRLRLIVAEKGVRLTLPRQASTALAEQFLAEHRHWLQQQLGKLPQTRQPPFSRGVDTHLPLRSAPVAIDWQEGRYTRVELGEHGVVIQSPAKAGDAQLRSALRDFYAQQARADIGRWLPGYLPNLPRAPSTFRLRPLSSLWGSLAPNDAVSLDLALVMGRPRAFEYVLVHELCHLIHRNHSRRYWREVEARCPDWREQRDYLHGEGLAIKAEMRRFKAG